MPLHHRPVPDAGRGVAEGVERMVEMSEYILEVTDGWKPVECTEEIVRCRDCKHSYEESRCTSMGWVDVLVCESKQWSTSSLMPSHTVNDDGFCKWGERK